MGKTLIEILEELDRNKEKHGDRKKPGRKKHTPNPGNVGGLLRDTNINVRASGATKKKLGWIRANSSTLAGMSDAGIIESLIDYHVLMQEVMHPHKPRFKG